ncbi:hypothetical protein Bca101_102028 [Brassica carinata]
MAFHTHTQPELSNLTWYQSQVHQNLSFHTRRAIPSVQEETFEEEFFPSSRSWRVQEMKKGGTFGVMSLLNVKWYCLKLMNLKQIESNALSDVMLVHTVKWLSYIEALDSCLNADLSDVSGSQEVFLVHHPSELKEEDFAHCVEQWRVEKEVVMRHWCVVSLKLTCKLGPILNPSLRRGVYGVSRQESVQSTLGCEKMKTLSVRLLIMKLSIQACSCFSNMVVTHEEEAAKTQLVSIKEDLAVSCCKEKGATTMNLDRCMGRLGGA